MHFTSAICNLQNSSVFLVTTPREVVWNRSFLDSLTLKIGPIRSPETSVSSQLTPRDNSEDGRTEFNRSESLRSRKARSAHIMQHLSSESWTGEDVEGDANRLIWGTILTFFWREWGKPRGEDVEGDANRLIWGTILTFFWREWGKPRESETSAVPARDLNPEAGTLASRTWPWAECHGRLKSSYL
jgi:hypothetical protein